MWTLLLREQRACRNSNAGRQDGLSRQPFLEGRRNRLKRIIDFKCLAWLTLFCSAFAFQAKAAMAPNDANASTLPPLYTATVDQQPVTLHAFSKGSFGIFSMHKPVDVQIRTDFDVRLVVVRPLSTSIHASIDADHRGIRFTAPTTTPLTIEFNNDLSHVMHLFPYTPEEKQPLSGDHNVVYFGPGVHSAGQINLTDGQTLYLAAGAWVKGNIRAMGAKNITIEGPGVLDASNLEEGSGSSGRNNPIYLQDTQDARIDGITVFNSNTWTVYLNRAMGTHIHAIKVLNPGDAYGDDGIDIVSSSNVLVEDAFIRANDDCVVVKNLSGLDTHDITVRHSVLWNMPHGGNGVEIGFETRNKTIHAIRFEDLDMIHIQHGAAISIHNGDAATVEDVLYDNIRVEDIRLKLIDFAIIYAQYGLDRPKNEEEILQRMDRGAAWDGILSYTPEEEPTLAAHRGYIRDIQIKGLRVVDGALPYSTLVGFDANHTVRNINIEGLYYQGRAIHDPASAKFSTQYTQNVVFH